jgi:hypothetical protein
MTEEQTPDQAQEAALLDSIRQRVSAGEDVRTKFDDFWDNSVAILEQNIRTSMGVTDDKQVANLLVFAKGVSRMTWASQLGIMSASFDQMASMEMAVTQVISEVAKGANERAAELEETTEDVGG